MQAIDLDLTAVLRYSFIEPIVAYSLFNLAIDVNEYNYTNLFRIDPSTGLVFVNGPLDISVVKRVVYTVQAVDIAAQGPVQSGTGKMSAVCIVYYEVGRYLVLGSLRRLNILYTLHSVFDSSQIEAVVIHPIIRQFCDS